MCDVYGNQTEIAKLSPGDSLLATDGKTYVFIRLERSTIIGKLEGKGYKIPVKSFVRLVQKSADIEVAKAAIEEATQYTRQRDILKTLGIGDMIRCNDGEVYLSLIHI